MKMVSRIFLQSLCGAIISSLLVASVVAQERDQSANGVAGTQATVKAGVDTGPGHRAAGGAAPNHCTDAGVDLAWRDKLIRYPDDPVVQRLFALRSGLCSMVETGQIDLAAAARLFEVEQGRAVIERLQDENQANPYRAL